MNPSDVYFEHNSMEGEKTGPLIPGTGVPSGALASDAGAATLAGEEAPQAIAIEDL